MANKKAKRQPAPRISDLDSVKPRKIFARFKPDDHEGKICAMLGNHLTVDNHPKYGESEAIVSDLVFVFEDDDPFDSEVICFKGARVGRINFRLQLEGVVCAVGRLKPGVKIGRGEPMQLFPLKAKQEAKVVAWLDDNTTMIDDRFVRTVNGQTQKPTQETEDDLTF